MMIFLWVALALLAVGVGLFKWADSWTIDASPVGSVMLVAGLGLGICSLFFAGIWIGTLIA